MGTPSVTQSGADGVPERKLMITVGMNYKVIPGKESFFENAFEGVEQAMESFDGHKVSRLLREVKDAQSYVILSEWTSKEEFESFIRSEQFQKVAQWGKEQVLAGRPSHEIYG